MSKLTSGNLPHKPLIEAILDVRWSAGNYDFNTPISNSPIDPYYGLMVGRFQDRLSSKFTHIEPLQSVGLPDVMTVHVPQYRFRTAQDEWPLIQIGPGVMTLNETDGYVWDTFLSDCTFALQSLKSAHPNFGSVKPTSVSLKYIDAVTVDDAPSLLTFLSEKLHVQITLPQSLFDGQRISSDPRLLDTKFAFDCTSPKGMVILHFVNGQVYGKPALVWETEVQSAGEHVPAFEDMQSWLIDSHSVTHEWFFELIKGDLYQRFTEGTGNG